MRVDIVAVRVAVTRISDVVASIATIIAGDPARGIGLDPFWDGYVFIANRLIWGRIFE